MAIGNKDYDFHKHKIKTKTARNYKKCITAFINTHQEYKTAEWFVLHLYPQQLIPGVQI